MLKVLVAYDGSECSKRALRDLRRAGLPERAEAIVLTVADQWIEAAVQGYPGGSLDAAYDNALLSLSDAKMSAMEASEILRGYFPGWEIRHEAVSGSAASAVMDKIKSWHPDLAVMGSHGRSAVGRLLFGSVSQKVLTHTHCNLRISRGPEKERPAGPLRILVAFDCSEESEKAFQAAICRNWPKGTEIKLVTVTDTRLSMLPVYLPVLVQYWMKNENPAGWLEQMLKDQKKRIRERGFVPYAEVLQGDPKRVLLGEAEKWGADAIFAGPRGLTGNERFVVGSVSTALATHSHCTVELVHRLLTETSCCGMALEEHRECMLKESPMRGAGHGQ